MSSGASIPYQLRPNKFVERLLFMELLEVVGRVHDVSNYAYVSMGGRFLADFKLVHARFGVKSLVSLESDDITYDRQVFNRPLSIIRCLNQDSNEFVSNFERFASAPDYDEHKFIIWLDHTYARRRQEQLQNYQSLVSKLGPYDIVKITLNANPNTLAVEQDGKDGVDARKERFTKLREQMGECFPPGNWGHKDMKVDGLARVLASATQAAAIRGCEGSIGMTIIPLAVFRYNDGFHQMLTVTAMVAPEMDKEEFLTDSRLREWEFWPDGWEDVTEICIPDLSLKERIYIDEMLFAESLEQVHGKLSFKFDKNNAKSLHAIEQYCRHYRRYPNFVHAYS